MKALQWIWRQLKRVPLIGWILMAIGAAIGLLLGRRREPVRTDAPNTGPAHEEIDEAAAAKHDEIDERYDSIEDAIREKFGRQE